MKTLMLALSLCLVSAGAMFASEGDDGVVETRDAVEKWIEVRKTISFEKNRWKFDKEMLEEQVRLGDRAVKSLQKLISEAEQNLGEADKKRGELEQESGKLKESASSLTDMVGSLESRTLSLLSRLPEWVQESVQLYSQRIPKDPAETELSLGRRFESVVAILNTVNKLNREIHVKSEVRELPGGKTAEVDAIYVGLSQGYYVTADKDAAGMGTSTAEGWVWSPVNDAAEKIADAVAIYRADKEAAFVRLPVKVD